LLEIRDSFTNRAILCPKNSDINKINLFMELIDSENQLYLTDNQVKSDNEFERNNFPIEF